VAKETGRNRVIRFDGNDFNAHMKGKENDTPDAEKSVSTQAGSTGVATPGAPPRVKASAESPTASA
jgi:hypothetical protein